MVNKEKRPASAATENKASDKTLMSNYNKKKKEIQNNEISPFAAAMKLLSTYFK